MRAWPTIGEPLLCYGVSKLNTALSFGPRSISWTQATTARDYAVRGLEDVAVWYAITVAVQIALACKIVRIMSQ